MKLDRSTYEAWLLDRSEGALTPAQERELDAFLLANPDLSSAIADLPHVDGGEGAFPMKDVLRRNFPPSGAPDAARLNDFLAARLEGDLSEEQEKQLDRYLYEYPQVARDAALMARMKLAREEIAFTDTTSIARHFPPHGLPDKHRLVDFLIAEAEGDLDAEQRAALVRYLGQHSESKREQRLIAATFVERDALVFSEKEALKKRAVRVVPLWSRLAIAASIALLLSAGWWLLREGRPAGNGGIARIEQALPQETTEQQLPAQKAPEAQAQTAVPEAPGSQGDDAVSNVKRGAAMAPHGPDHSPTDQRSADKPRRTDQALPALQPIQRIPRAAIPDQTLAQVSSEESDGAIASAPATAPATNTAISSDGKGENLGTFLANKMRSDVLDAPRRAAELDGTDAVAMADRAIGKITGGQGGVDVQRSATRDRIHVSLGRNFSLSASRGR